MKVNMVMNYKDRKKFHLMSIFSIKITVTLIMGIDSFDRVKMINLIKINIFILKTYGMFSKKIKSR